MAAEKTGKKTQRGSRGRFRKKRSLSRLRLTRSLRMLANSVIEDTQDDKPTSAPTDSSNSSENDNTALPKKQRLTESDTSALMKTETPDKQLAPSLPKSSSQSEDHFSSSVPSPSPSTTGEARSEPSQHAAQPAEPSHQDRKPDFEACYLQMATAEFATDLEKLRQAPDFKDSSVPILIEFLKQGAKKFSEEEKRSAMERVR